MKTKKNRCRCLNLETLNPMSTMMVRKKANEWQIYINKLIQFNIEKN